MKKSKAIPALLLTLGLLIFGALLPGIVGAMQTRFSMKSGFGEIQSVDLKLKEPLTLMEKLFVLADGHYYPIFGETKLTAEELPQVVEEALGPYYYRDLMPYNWEDVDFSAEPYLIYRNEAPEVNYAVWVVELKASDWTAGLHIDDETGKLLSIEHTAMEAQWQFTTEAYMQNVKEAWFEALGLYDTHWNFKDCVQVGNTWVIRGEYYDASDGGLAVEFTTYPNGYWTFLHQ